MSNRFLDSLAALLSRMSEAPSRGTAGPEAAARRGARAKDDLSGGLTPIAFESQLGWVLGGATQLLPGRLVFIRATGIVQRFGPKWEAAADRAEAIAARTIERHLSLPDDAYLRLDALTYLVLFAKTPTAIASAASARIATEIAEQLLGASWVSVFRLFRTDRGRS